MNENVNVNSSSCFDDLFQGRDWIVTKNEEGKVKVARCGEDEVDNLYETRTDWLIKNVEEKQTEGTTNATNNGPKWKEYSTAMFLIRDLLNCECQDGSFRFKNICFRDVFVSGTIVSLLVRSDNYYITVDDGTSSIICLMKQEQFASLKMSEEEHARNCKLIESLKANPEDPMLKAAAMVMRSLQDLNKNIPSFDDLKLGDIVTLIGTLKEYKSNRNIFIRSIEKEPEGSIYHTSYLEELLNLYTNRYKD